MKIWLKYLVGICLGIILALILPVQFGSEESLSQFLSDFFISVGRYSLYPLLFFGFTIGVYELRDERQLFRVGVKSSATIIVLTLLFTITGVVSVLLFRPARIPIFVEEMASPISVGVKQSLMALFPSSAFEAFCDGLFILPLCILAGFAGAACVTDKVGAKPVVTLFDSLCKVSYAVMAFFVDLMIIAMIAISFYWTIEFKSMMTTDVFRDVIILLVIDLVVISCGILPLMIRIFYPKVNPYRVLYASLASAFAGFFSGDSNLALPIMIRHSRESLGIRRRVSSVVLPMFSVFCRAGTALVVSVGFIVIFKSYSAIPITFLDIVWIASVASGLSFLLGRFPSGGVYVALAVLCSLYGRDLNAGYLILKPMAFFMGSVATMLDVFASIFGTFFVAKSEDMLNHRETRFFI